MTYLATCSKEEALNFSGSLYVFSSDGKNKKEKVYLNVEVEDETQISDITCAAVACLTVKNIVTGKLPAKYKNRVFYEIALADIAQYDFSLLGDIVPLVCLPRDYCNMLELSRLCREHPSLRFIGGNLLRIPGIHIGRVDDPACLGVVSKDKLPLICNGQYDVFQEIGLTDLGDLQEERGKIEVVKPSPKTKTKASKTAKKKQAFTDVFGSEGQQSF